MKTVINYLHQLTQGELPSSAVADHSPLSPAFVLKMRVSPPATTNRNEQFGNVMSSEEIEEVAASFQMQIQERLAGRVAG
jgi:hypothetical protein